MRPNPHKNIFGSLHCTRVRALSVLWTEYPSFNTLKFKRIKNCIIGSKATVMLWWIANGWIFNRPGVAGAVLLTALSFIHNFIHSLTQSSFTSRSSKHHKSQTGRARKLTIWDNVHPSTMCHMSGVTCQVSHVICHVSGVTYQVSHDTFFFFCFWQSC